MVQGYGSWSTDLHAERWHSAQCGHWPAAHSGLRRKRRNYKNCHQERDINVEKATPTVNWDDPADIIYGTALSGTQLNATLHGSWMVHKLQLQGQRPTRLQAGTLLNAGAGQNSARRLRPDQHRQLQ